MNKMFDFLRDHFHDVFFLQQTQLTFTWMRNFIWSGDVNQRKLATVPWKKVCSPLKEGGLGIRSLSNINEGANLKLCWELCNSNHHWAQFLRCRVLKNRKPINYHLFSSIWSSIKHKFPDIKSNSFWNLGNGQDINFWLNNWCGAPLSETLQIPHNLHDSLTASVDMFIVDLNWYVPDCVSLQTHAWWDHIPHQIGADFTRDRLGMSNYKFC